MNKYLKLIGIPFIAIFLFWLMCIHYTDTHQVAIVHNNIKGSVYIDSTPGINITHPFVNVYRFDIRPEKICITSASRNCNCKLVNFKPSGLLDLVALEGFRYYWWDNRISFNLGYNEEYRGTKDLLRGYSFDDKSYSFINVSEILK